ncbi:hypothetical protein K501DRAFT_288329 [Backusella circina FSU 941]|nr:hypothetical protein K501DRAFT_288329 [Backusella circina FSU 941]
MENKPSSPKELATIINKYKYATLGGATPFATVSSRISQHFKRAATHNPPRPPLLEKHVDQHHSRKISYSLALDSSSSSSSTVHNNNNNNKRKQHTDTSSVSSLSSLSDSESDPVLILNNKKKRKVLKSQDKPHYPDDEDDTNSEHSDYHEEMLIDDNDNTTISHTPYHLPSRRYSIQSNAPAERKASFCSGYPTGTDQELWTSFSLNNEQHHDEQHHSDMSAHLIPFHIDTPESVSVSELDNYFASDRKRKSLSRSMLGPNDESLLEKVLLDSAAKGVADKLQHGTESNTIEKDTNNMEVIHEEEEEEETMSLDQKQKQRTLMSNNDLKTFNSDAMNGEDFVHFEEEEEEEEKEEKSSAIHLPSSSSSLSSPSPSPSTKTTATIQHNTPASTRKVADILPAATTNQQQNIINATEILKSMNIQTLNLTALHHMTSSIPSLQHLSPAFDLAKTMAAYMQSLAKSANANSSTPLATDLKNILSRFPALEAFIKKDPSSSSSNTAPSIPASTIPSSSPSSPSISSPSSSTLTLSTSLALNSNGNSPAKQMSKPYVPPNHIQGKDQVVYTINSLDPAMYITVIDSIAVCIVVFSTKTSPPQEYRIMRRLDNQFINGTVLLTAGGIETERERSMILSFEMDRVRMPKPENALFGTWIPLRRAQELACTCSIQNTLAQFLDNDVLQFFPTPLPIKIVSKKKPTIQDNRNHRLAALALAALRNQSNSKQSKQSSTMELLIDNPNKLLKTSQEPEMKRSGGKWASTPLIKKSASWNGAIGVKRQPTAAKRKSKQQEIKHLSDNEDEEVIIDIEDDEENVVVEHSTLKKESVTTVKQEVETERIETKADEKKVILHEEDDDEDIDIGGSDCDDDLR